MVQFSHVRCRVEFVLDICPVDQYGKRLRATESFVFHNFDSCMDYLLEEGFEPSRPWMNFIGPVRVLPWTAWTKGLYLEAHPYRRLIEIEPCD